MPELAYFPGKSNPQTFFIILYQCPPREGGLVWGVEAIWMGLCLGVPTTRRKFDRIVEHNRTHLKPTRFDRAAPAAADRPFQTAHHPSARICAGLAEIRCPLFGIMR